MIKSKVLIDRSDLQVFVDNYNQGSKKRKVEDLEGIFVRAFFSGSEMLGGYSINTKSPVFHIDMIPSNHVSTLPLLKEKNLNLTEIRSLWIKSRASNVLRAIVYCRSVLDAAATRPSYIIGGTFTERYRKTQMRALPRLLYFGDVNVWNKKQEWWIFYGKPFECVSRLPYAVIGGWIDRITKH